MIGESEATGELGRYEAQRRALGNLLGRFTADRDALIASIQACEEQIASLNARLDSGAGEVRATADPSAATKTVDLDAVRQMLDELRAEQRRSALQQREEIDKTRQRADEAMDAVEALTEPAAADQTAVDEMRGELERMSHRLQQLENALERQLGSLQQTVDAAQAGSIARLQEQLTPLQAEISAVQSDLARLSESATNEPRLRGRAIAEGLKELQAATLDDLRAQVEALRGAAAAGPVIRQVWNALLLCGLASAVGIAVLSSIH